MKRSFFFIFLALITISQVTSQVLSGYDGYYALIPAPSLLDFLLEGPEQWPYLRNEIYAQYGRSFQTEKYQEHFGLMPWYQISPEYSDALLTPRDEQNLGNILNLERPSRSKQEITNEILQLFELELGIELEDDNNQQAMNITGNFIFNSNVSGSIDVDENNSASVEFIYGTYYDGPSVIDFNWTVVGEWIIMLIDLSSKDEQRYSDIQKALLALHMKGSGGTGRYKTVGFHLNEHQWRQINQFYFLLK